MIRVNLLEGELFPQKEREEGSPSELTFQELGSVGLLDAQPGLKIMIMVTPIFLLFIYEKVIHYNARRSYSKTSAAVAQSRDIFNKKKSHLEKVEGMKKEYSQFLPFKEEFENISKEKIFVIQSLDLLQDILPREVWFSKIKLNKIGIDIQGQSNSDIALNAFEKNLTESSRFKDILIYNSVEKKFLDGRIGVNFRMKANFQLKNLSIK